MKNKEENGRKQTGRLGEDMAVAYLKKSGYEILERNYRCMFGEVDIVAKDGKVIVFIEVKSRRSERFGEPQAAVGPDKQRKLSLISLKYLKERRLYPCDARFDVAAVRILPDGGHIELIKNAFELALD
jgi:putative endonuclease